MAAKKKAKRGPKRVYILVEADGRCAGGFRLMCIDVAKYDRRYPAHAPHHIESYTRDEKVKP